MRFTIRDLLWLTVVVALAVGWWLDRRAWNEKYATQSIDSSTWQARAEELEVRTEILAERLRLSQIPNHSAPAPNPPQK